MTSAMLGLAVFFTLLWSGSVVHLGIAHQLHHFWYGLAAFIVGLWLGWAWLAWVGLVVMGDDALQHAVQCVRPQFRSPLHLLARATVYRWGWVR